MQCDQQSSITRRIFRELPWHSVMPTTKDKCHAILEIVSRLRQCCSMQLLDSMQLHLGLDTVRDHFRRHEYEDLEQRIYLRHEYSTFNNVYIYPGTVHDDTGLNVPVFFRAGLGRL